jgi:ATP-binding protein involved in chromosome partitioning
VSQERSRNSSDKKDSSAKDKRPGETMEQWKERQAIIQKMHRIKHKILVMSGKGGVGKSTVAANLSFELSQRGYKVGLMDVDIHGPNIPKMLGVETSRVGGTEDMLIPVQYSPNLKLISIGFFLRKESDAVIWRGPLKMRLISQFLKDVDWGELDYLIIDAPPGTGDEPLSVCQLIEDADGALIVTTPQDVSIIDIVKSITFCHQVNMPIVGIIENMSGFVCPHCGKTTYLFKSGGGKKVAQEAKVPFLGSIPFEPSVVEAGDEGIPLLQKKPESEAAKAFSKVVDSIVEQREKVSKTKTSEKKNK